MSTAASQSLLLAMDTSGDVCSVALFREGRLCAELAFRHEMHLSERLITHVDFLLGQVGAQLREVGAFAVGIGPGSFTGTRIGVMTMKTFAFLQDRPLVGVNAMEAMAAEYGGIPGRVVSPVLACRSGVVYAAGFTVDGQEPAVVAEPRAYPFAELASALGATGSPVLFCGPAAGRYRSELEQCLDGRVEVTFGTVKFPRASAIGRLAALRRDAGRAGGSPLELVPLYISPPPITMPKQPIPT